MSDKLIDWGQDFHRSRGSCESVINVCITSIVQYGMAWYEIDQGVITSFDKKKCSKVDPKMR